jgi:radical SAM superfamily enzyme YgiQ (UPF0313 family)
MIIADKRNSIDNDVVFYQQYGVPYFGILLMEAHLRNSGYRAAVVIDSMERDPIAALRRLKPSIVGISVLSTEHRWLVEKVRAIRKVFPETLLVVGGIHAMFYFEEILRETPVDIVCHSEGEEVLPLIVAEANRQSPNWEGVEGIAFRSEDGQIRVNERARLVPFLDTAVEDRSIYYDRYPQISTDHVHRFFSSRGCPFRCSFCYNGNIRDLFHGKGQYVRQKSVDYFIEEIKTQCSRYPIKSIFFYDDLFTFKKEWLRAFLKSYKSFVGLPFWCTTRADTIDEETVSLLAGAGCHTVSFGIETGSYPLRAEVLRKKITDEQIVHCGRLLNSYGLKTQTTNMFCLPGEDLRSAFRTIELNIAAKAGCAFSALFMPFPKTGIAEYCVQKGLLHSGFSLKDLPHSFLNASLLNVEDKSAIINVHRLAYFFIKWPWTYSRFRSLVQLRFLSPLFQLVFLIGTFLRHKEERGISFWPALRYAWRLRKSF